MSKVVDLDVDGNLEKVLPKDITYDPVSDEPNHIDFMRIVKGSKLILDVPVKFINHDKSPGLKKGAVLNTVRRKIELKCLAESIPNEIVVDLNNTEINSSLKISSVKLPTNVVPTILDRDFVIATVASPTILVETVKTEEVVAEDGTVTEGVEGTAEGTVVTEEGKEKTAKPSDDKAKVSQGDKEKTAKPSDNKAKAAPENKGKFANKETKKK